MKNLSDKQIAIIAVITAAITSGAGPVFIKIALRDLSPEYFSFLRFFLSSLVLMPLFLKSRIKINKDVALLATLSLLSTANILLFAHGVKLTTATIAQLLYVLSPLAVFIFSMIFINEKMTVFKILGVILGGIGGFVIILLPQIQKGASFSGDLKGNLLITTGVLLFSLYLVLSKRIQAKFSPVQITMVFTITTTIVMFILTVPELIRINPGVILNNHELLFSILYVGIIATALYYVLQQYAVKHGSPLISSTMLFLQPLATIVWAGIILGEKLTPILIVGGILVLTGTYFITKSNNKAKVAN